MNLAVAIAICVISNPQKPMTDQQWANDVVQRYHIQGLKTRHTRTHRQMAAVIFLAWSEINRLTDEIDGDTQRLDAKVNRFSKLPEAERDAQVPKIREWVSALKAKVRGLKGGDDDIERMKKLVLVYHKDHESMGADLPRMKTRLADLSKRVALHADRQ